MKTVVFMTVTMLCCLILLAQKPPLFIAGKTYSFSMYKDSFDKYVQELGGEKLAFCTKDEIDKLVRTLETEENKNETKLRSITDNYRKLNDTLIKLLESDNISVLDAQINKLEQTRDSVYKNICNNISRIHYSTIFALIIQSRANKYSKSDLSDFAQMFAMEEGIRKYGQSTLSDSIVINMPGIRLLSDVDISRNLKLKIQASASAGSYRDYVHLLNSNTNTEALLMVCVVEVFPFKNVGKPVEKRDENSSGIIDQNTYTIEAMDILDPSGKLNEFLARQQKKFPIKPYDLERIREECKTWKSEIGKNNCQEYEDETRNVAKIKATMKKYEDELIEFQEKRRNNFAVLTRIIGQQANRPCMPGQQNIDICVRQAENYIRSNLARIKREYELTLEQRYFRNIVDVKTDLQGTLTEQIYYKLKVGRPCNLDKIEQGNSLNLGSFREIEVTKGTQNGSVTESVVVKNERVFEFSGKIKNYWLYIYFDTASYLIQVNIISTLDLTRHQAKLTDGVTGNADTLSKFNQMVIVNPVMPPPPSPGSQKSYDLLSYEKILPATALICAAIGFSYLSKARDHYQEYKNSTTRATSLHNQVVAEDIMTFSAFTVSGLCTILSFVRFGKAKTTQAVQRKLSLLAIPQNGGGVLAVQLRL